MKGLSRSRLRRHLHARSLALLGVLFAALWLFVELAEEMAEGETLAFDRAMQRLAGGTLKTVPIRVLHAVLFEAGLLLVLAPFIAWYLGVGLWHAVVMDVAFALFYMVYAFAFNWGYDRLFPIPEWQVPQGQVTH
jgi:uncharacterized membrane protein